MEKIKILTIPICRKCKIFKSSQTWCYAVYAQDLVNMYITEEKSFLRNMGNRNMATKEYVQIL